MSFEEDVLRELTAIRRLLAFKFMKDGMSQEALAEALGVNQSSVSRMFAATSKKAKPRRRS